MAPSGNAVGFWERPEEALDRAAGIGCNSFRFSVEWARVVPEDGPPDKQALIHYAAIVDGCLERGLTPLVTLHHFTHPAWLGEQFWLRPDAADRFRDWVRIVVDTLGDEVRHWVTINEINALALDSWVLGVFPPGRLGALDDMHVAIDGLLTAHIRAYEVIRSAQPDATVTTNNACLSVYEGDRLLVDLLMSRSFGIERGDVDDWIAERRARHDALLPARTMRERMVRRLGAWRSVYGRSSAGPSAAPASRPRRRLREPVRANPRRRWASTSTSRWRVITSACPVTAPSAGAKSSRARPCGTIPPTPTGFAVGSASSTPWCPTSRSWWSRTACATGW